MAKINWEAPKVEVLDILDTQSGSSIGADADVAAS